MKIRLPLQLLVSTVLVVMVLVVGGTIGGVAYFMSLNSIETSARATVHRVVTDLQQDLWNLVNPALDAVKILGQSSLGDATSLTQRLQRLGLAVEVLNDMPILSSVQIGYVTGDFFAVRKLKDGARSPAWPELARYEVQSIERGSLPARELTLYFDQNLQLLKETINLADSHAYDPRDQEWFSRALQPTQPTVVATTPYLLYGRDTVGTSAAMRTNSGRAVVSADVTLGEVSAYLWKERVTPHSILALVNVRGSIVAYDTGPGSAKLRKPEVSGGKLEMPTLTNSGIPVLTLLNERLRDTNRGEPYSSLLTIDDVTWRVNVLPFDLPSLPPATLISAVPENELLAEPHRQLSIYIWITVGFILFIIPVALLIAHRITRALRALNKEAESILNFEFSGAIQIDSAIREVDRVARTMQTMKQSIYRFLEVSRVVSSEEDFDHLLQTLLKETVSASQASAGVLYLSDDDHFVPTAALCPASNTREGLRGIALKDTCALMRAAIDAGTPIGAVLDDDTMASLGLAHEAAHARFAVAAPLRNRHGKLLGLILLLRESPSAEAQLSFIRALTDSAAVSLEARELISSQKALFEAFIQLIAGAIDAKSPHTGAHCKRVPELTKMLVRAACSETQGPYADFQPTEPEWEAVHLAAWLHDCGKIITPVHVIDKATKLETIHNRIHEIRTRFEVLRRDATITYLRSIAAGEDPATSQARLDAENKQLDEDFEFVATCNVGGESMSPAHVERLLRIAARTWSRTFDDRLGLSYEESQRKASFATSPLPATEKLLDDKDEHKFVRGEADRLPKDNPWGFKTHEPEFLYDSGEIHNLSISRGTLSEEERYIINQHITQTIIMLSSLPFPKHLRGVADIAGGHHERMDGNGYPRGLTKDEMTPVSRMMAIADIFEALTAIDRPYKQGKTLSESLRIMQRMKQNQHIDPELFELFLRSGVYKAYAQQYMKPEQIDAVDIEALMR